MSFVTKFITQQPLLNICLFYMKGENIVVGVPLRKEEKNEQGRQCWFAKRKCHCNCLRFQLPICSNKRLRTTLVIKPKIHLDKCPLSNNSRCLRKRNYSNKSRTDIFQYTLPEARSFRDFLNQRSHMASQWTWPALFHLTALSVPSSACLPKSSGTAGSVI